MECGSLGPQQTGAQTAALQTGAATVVEGPPGYPASPSAGAAL